MERSEPEELYPEHRQEIPWLKELNCTDQEVEYVIQKSGEYLALGLSKNEADGAARTLLMAQRLRDAKEK